MAERQKDNFETVSFEIFYSFISQLLLLIHQTAASDVPNSDCSYLLEVVFHEF